MSSNPHISFSICIVCYNTRPSQLLELIDSLSVAVKSTKKQFALSIIPVYIVDNSASTETWNHLKNKHSDYFNQPQLEFHYISGHGNIGYGSAHNLILDKLSSDFHLILNPDVIVDKESLVNAITVINEGTNVIGLSPHAENMVGEKQHLCKRYPSLFTLFIRGVLTANKGRFFTARLSNYEMRELSQKEDSKNIPLISGCFMLLDTRVLKDVGGFNESYFLYFEDFDLSIRVRKYGELVYSPKVRIKHLGGGASKKGLRHILAFVRSGFRFFNTHGWRFF